MQVLGCLFDRYNNFNENFDLDGLVDVNENLRNITDHVTGPNADSSPVPKDF